MTARRRIGAAALVLAAAPALSACGAGFSAATDKVEADNASGAAGGLLARAVVVVKDPAAIAAAFAGTFINNGEATDVLTSIDLTENTVGARTVTVTPNIVLTPGQVVALGAGEREPVTVPNATGLRAGRFANVVLRFRDAGVISMQAPIAAPSEVYAEITPSPRPTATQGATRRARAQASNL